MSTSRKEIIIMSDTKEQDRSEIVNEMRGARQDEAVDRMRQATTEAKHHHREMEALIDVRHALDGIAQTLAAFDVEPEPGRFESRAPVCRICRLLVERYRSIAAFVERDPDLLAQRESAEVLKSYLRDLTQHRERSAHDPLRAMSEAMLEQAQRG